MFAKDELLLLQNFCQRILERPRPIDAQPHTIKDGFIWCDDWRIIEILKYFFNGPEMYAGDPPPNRLKGNPLWSKDAIIEEAKTLFTLHGSATNLINHLEQERNKPYGTGA